MLDQIIRFGTVTLIAIMLWLYAEGATRRQYQQTFNIKFVAAQGQDLLIERDTQSVTADIRCASSQIQQVRNIAETPLIVELSEVPGKPVRQINILQLLPLHERLNRLGITIERVDPETVDVRVEKLEEKRVAIELAKPQDLELASPATFSPDFVVVKLPAGRALQIEGLKLIAPLDQNLLAGVVEGVPTDRDVVVTLPPAMADMSVVDYFPRKVKVTFTVKKKEDEFVIGLVPVVLNIAPNLARQYDVAVDQENLLLRDVKVKGPSDMITRIKSGQVKVEALLRLDPEDLEKKIPSKLPELRLPAGVTVESTLPLIKLTITKREIAAP